MKMTQIYAGKALALSFEVFPPKTPEGTESMYRSVEQLCVFRPAFLSCTYGAGGSTRDQTLQIVTSIRDRFHVDTVAHFTCVGSTIRDAAAWLERAGQAGIDNIMALRGDPPRDQKEFVPIEGGMAHADELVRLIRQQFPHFGIGVAGYPETHQEALSAEADLVNLKRKVDAGADAVFTQLFYDNGDFLRFRDRCRATGIAVPIIPGLLPILSLKQIQRITSMCRARLPTRLVSRLQRFAEDPLGQIAIGIEHATAQCEGLLAARVSGIHFYVLNKSDATCQILRGLDLHTGTSGSS